MKLGFKLGNLLRIFLRCCNFLLSSGISAAYLGSAFLLPDAFVWKFYSTPFKKFQIELQPRGHLNLALKFN